MWVQLATLALQLGVTGRFMPRFGLGAALAITPLLTAVGFLGLAMLPTLGMLTVIKALRGATHYAFERPGREVLSPAWTARRSTSPRTSSTTVVYRGSDTASSWLEKSLAGLGLGVAESPPWRCRWRPVARGVAVAGAACPGARGGVRRGARVAPDAVR
jgi:AAA family ATP:ADP antiporter